MQVNFAATSGASAPAGRLDGAARTGTERTAFLNRSLASFVSFACRAFCCVCVLLGGSSAWAGWNVTYDYKLYNAAGTLTNQQVGVSTVPDGSGAGKIEVTAVFTWVASGGGTSGGGSGPPTGGGSDPLPPKLYVRVSSHAYAASANSQGAVTANDGLGDATVDQPFGNGVARTSEGTHLFQRDHPGTQERFGPYTLTATATFGNSASMTFSAAEDTRGVTITSSRDITYHRDVQNGVPTRVANVPDKNGTVQADTRGNDAVDPNIHWLFQYWNNLWFFQQITYNGNHWGDWSTTFTRHNLFEWTYSFGECDAFGFDSGEWFPSTLGFGGIPHLVLRYYPDAKGMPGQTEQVHLKATAIDGAVAENDYVMTFHKAYELVRIFERKNLPQLPVNQHLDEWEYLTEVPNYTAEWITKDVQVKRSKKGVIKWSLSAQGKAEKIHISELAGTYEETLENAVETTVPYALQVPAKRRRYFYQGLAREWRRGESAKYDTDGYTGDAPWNYTSTSGFWAVEPDPTRDLNLGEAP